MSGSRLRRFLRLELPGMGSRRRRRSAAIEGRFGPEPEPRVEVLENEAGPRPTVRCARCGAACGVLEPRCGGCGADLERPEQLEFQERSAAEARGRAARDAAQEAERRMLRARAAGQARARTGPGPAPAPEEVRPGVWRGVAAASAALLALAATVAGPPEGWRWAALGAATVLVAALVVLRRGGRRT